MPSPFSDMIYYAPAGDLTDVDDLPAHGAAIESTYPNPFNPLIRVRYAVSTQDDGANLALDILDVRGRLVRSLDSGPHARAATRPPGTAPTPPAAACPAARTSSACAAAPASRSGRSPW